MIDRLNDRDLWILKQLRAKIGAMDIGDRVQANFTAAEAALLLRTIDFAMAAEQYMREREREARKPKQVEEKPPLLEDK